MKQSVLRRVLSVLLCVSLLLGVSVVRPQKAEAFAISASLVASVIMIMTACGVTFWASTQGDAESYISEKLGEYLDTLNPVPGSILEWLNIQSLVDLFTVINGGVVRFDSNVANPILDFVRWFNAEEDVESGASDVVSYPDGWSGQPIPYSISNKISDKYNSWYKAAVVNPSGSSGSFVSFSYNESDGDVFVTAYTSDNSVYFLVGTSLSSGITTVRRCRADLNNGIPGGSSATNPVSLNRTSGECLYSDVVNFSIPVSDNLTVFCPYFTTKDDALAALIAVCSNGIIPISVITPSDVVAVPDELTEDDDFDVSPSVGLTQGMSVDNVTDAIMGGVVSQDGLSSEIYTPPVVDLTSIASRLDDIESALLALDNAVDSVDGDTSAIQGSISTLLSRASSIQNSITLLDNNLDNVDDNVNDVALAVSGISGQIDNLESDVAGLVGSLGSISQGNSEIQESIAGLSSAISALDDDMELVKDALAGLTANDSLVDDVADIKTNTSGLSGFLSSIQYYIERVIDVLTDFFSGFFDNLASAFIDLINSLKAMLLDLFIPDEAFVDAFVADLQFKMDNHFSILSYPFSLFGRFIGESALQTEGDGILSWPDIYEPFSNTLLIRAGSYRLYDVVDEYGHNFYRAYDLYRIVLQGYITFDFISYLYFWFCDVFKMRELDFPNPLEVEE